MAYFGPAREARQYFIDMGYAPHNRQTTADFLVSVTDPNGRTRRANHIGPIPSTADEFAAYFLKSSLGSANSQDIQDYKREFVGKPDKANDFMHSAREERARYTNVKSPYTVSMPMQARAVMKRRVQIMFGNKISVIFTLMYVPTMFAMTSSELFATDPSSCRLSSWALFSSAHPKRPVLISAEEEFYFCSSHFCL